MLFPYIFINKNIDLETLSSNKAEKLSFKRMIHTIKILFSADKF